MMRWFAVGVLVLAACSSGKSSPANGPKDTTAAAALPQQDFGVPTCAEWMTRPVKADEVQSGCAVKAGVEGTAVHPCDDGSVLYWNDAGWGYVGQRMKAYTAGAEQVAPDADRTGCPA